MSGDIPKISGNISNKFETSSVSPGVEAQDLYEELMLLIAQGSGLLNKAVETQRNIAMRLQSQLDFITRAENELLNAMPQKKSKHEKAYIPADVFVFLYDSGLMPSKGSAASGLKKFIEQVEGYLATNPNPVSPTGDSQHKIDPVELDIFQALKQAMDGAVSQKSTEVSKQSTVMTNLMNAIHAKMNLLTSASQNQASAEKNIIGDLKPKR